MKTTFRSLLYLLLVTTFAGAEPEESAKQLLRDGLFEEEANEDLDKAEAAYKKLIQRYEVERRYAGTALFRLAEIARKRGEKEQAAELWQRVVREFGDQEALTAKAEVALAQLGRGVPPSPRNAAVGVSSGGPVAVGEERKELDRLEILKVESPDLLDGLDRTGFYPLHRAAAEGWIHVIDFLLEEKVSVDPRSSRTGMTPLHLAVVHGRLGVVKKLLAGGADHAASFSAKAEELPVPPPAALKGAGGTWTTMHLAVAYGRRSVAEALLKDEAGTQGDRLHTTTKTRQTGSGANLGTSVYYSDWVTPLMLAITLQDTEMVKFLLASGVDIDQVTPYENRTALTYALAKRLQYADLLLDAGADPNVGESGNYTALQLALGNRELEMVKRLLAAGADPNALRRNEDPDGRRTIFYAVGRGPEFVRVLLAAGARPTVTAVSEALEDENLEELKLLAETDAAKEMMNEPLLDGKTLLFFAASKELAEVLVQAGAEVDKKDMNGRSILDTVAEGRDTPERRALFEYLLAEGAKPSLLLSESGPIYASSSRTSRSNSRGEDSSVVLETLIPFALERLIYPDAMKPDRIQLVSLNERQLLSGERRRIDGTPAPTIPELLASANGLGGGVVARIRVLRMVDEELIEVASVSEVDLVNEPAPSLRWGDLLEVTRKDNSVGWLTRAQYDYTPRTITLTMGPWEEKVTIAPDPEVSRTHIRSSIFLDRFLGRFSRVFDLRKVTIRRGTAEPLELDYTVEGDGERLRLLDGDVIEAPLLPGEEGEASWDGVVVIHPDLPVGEMPPRENVYRPKSLFELLKIAGSWSGGRDLSRIEVRSKGGEVTVLDVGTIMDQFPTYEWSASKFAHSDHPLKTGDLVILHPRKEVPWKTRSTNMSLTENRLRNFLQAIYPGDVQASPTASPASRTGTRVPSRPRVVLPPSR